MVHLGGTMEYLTNLIGKSVLSIFEQRIVGTVLNAEFDTMFRRVKHLIILSTDEENIFMLPFSKIYSIDAIVTIRNSNDLIVAVEQTYPTLIGCQVYGLSAKSYGKVLEVGLERGVTQIIYADITIEISHLFGVNSHTIIINDLDKKLYKHHFAPRTTTPPSRSTQIVSILTDANNGIAMPKTITAQPLDK